MASTGNPVSGTTKTYVGDIGLTAGLIACVGSAPNRVTVASAIGQRPIGVIDRASLAGAPTRVTRFGDTPVTAGAAIPNGAYVKTDARGRAIPVTGTAGSGEEVLGRAESVATADGDTIIVFVSPFVF